MTPSDPIVRPIEIENVEALRTHAETLGMRGMPASRQLLLDVADEIEQLREGLEGMKEGFGERLADAVAGRADHFTSPPCTALSISDTTFSKWPQTALENQRLREVNAELLAACKAFLALLDEGPDLTDVPTDKNRGIELARSAIARAEKAVPQ
jgi:hypothetical protein